MEVINLVFGVLFGLIGFGLFLLLNSLGLFLSCKLFELEENYFSKAFLVVLFSTLIIGVFSILYFVLPILYLILVLPLSVIVYLFMIKKFYFIEWKETFFVELVFLIIWLGIVFVFGAIFIVFFSGLFSSINEDSAICITANDNFFLENQFTCIDKINNELRLNIRRGSSNDFSLSGIQVDKYQGKESSFLVINALGLRPEESKIFEVPISSGEQIERVSISPIIKEENEFRVCSSKQSLEISPC